VGVLASQRPVVPVVEDLHWIDHPSAQARVEVDDMIAEGDKVFVLARMTGTQRGEFLGIAATGNTIDVSICDYFRVEAGALIEHWGVMDAAGMMQQLTAH
jgi:predicted ester cyclase